MAVQERLYTAADLWVLSHADEGRRYELDEGALIEMSPTGDRHGVVVVQVTYLLRAYLETHDLGEISGAETGYRVTTTPDSVLAPDVGFVLKERLQPMTGKYYEMAPDLAVEVVSPNDSARQIRRKVDQYLRAGTGLIWIIFPEDRFVDVYQPDHDPRQLKPGDTLDGGRVLPGLTLSVEKIFARLR